MSSRAERFDNVGADGLDWFERLTGFRETSYGETQFHLSALDGRLHSRGTDRTYGVGTLTLPLLAELRTAMGAVRQPGGVRLSIVEGDVRAMSKGGPSTVGLILEEHGSPPLRPRPRSRTAACLGQGPSSPGHSGAIPAGDRCTHPTD